MRKDLAFKSGKILSAVVAAGLISVFCLVSACSNKNPDAIESSVVSGTANDAGTEAVLPPETEGNGILSAMLKACPFEECMDTSDLIAYVAVGNWLGESDKQQGYYSFYEASVIESYKGNVSGKITLKQDGNSQAQFKRYPLFKAGDELLLFLKESADDSGNTYYYIRGSYSTVLYAVYNEAGNRYFADYIGLIHETAEGLDTVSVPYEELYRPDGSVLTGTPKALYEAAELAEFIKEYRI